MNGAVQFFGTLLTGTDPKNKCPPALLRDFGAVRYDASECICKIVSNL